MKSEFPLWFKFQADTSSSSSSSSYTNEVRALAHGPLNAYSYTACIVNGVRFVVHRRDVRRTTQNSGVVSIGEDGTPFYGQLEDIIELNYIGGYSVVLFRCKWFNTMGNRLINEDNRTFIDVSREWYVGKQWYDGIQYILATQAKQVFYLIDPSRTTGNWRVVEDVHHRKLWDHPSMSVVNEIDVLHDTQSSKYNLIVDPDCEVVESSNKGGDPSSIAHADTQSSARDNQSSFGKLVVDLGNLPMRTTIDEGGDDGFIDDDDDDEDDGECHSDEEDEINDDNEDDDDEEDEDVVDTHYCSDDSD
jgi:hypothetical protein